MFKWHLTRSLLEYVLVTVLLFANFRFCVYNNMFYIRIQGSLFSSEFKTTIKRHNVLYSALVMFILRNRTCGTHVHWVRCYLVRFISIFSVTKSDQSPRCTRRIRKEMHYYLKFIHIFFLFNKYFFLFVSLFHDATNNPKTNFCLLVYLSNVSVYCLDKRIMISAFFWGFWGDLGTIFSKLFIDGRIELKYSSLTTRPRWKKISRKPTLQALRTVAWPKLSAKNMINKQPDFQIVLIISEWLQNK